MLKGVRDFEYTVPDTFNGKLRLLAVMVNDTSIGTAVNAAKVRGDFVLSPNAPLTVTPGDTFDVNVGVANNVQGSGKDASVTLNLAATSAFELIGAAKKTLKISELRDGVGAKLGSARLEFTASFGSKFAKLGTEISVRPATPHLTIMLTGSFKGDTQIVLSVTCLLSTANNKPAFRHCHWWWQVACLIT